MKKKSAGAYDAVVGGGGGIYDSGDDDRVGDYADGYAYDDDLYGGGEQGVENRSEKGHA
eukprot:CAMPEP_0185280054 /NCGR_PEP_ID=MMETSP1359-20130426/65137_1 /TAXON_ID=552665 /ORGANISM="Bigelowiella longifila, Strain CCMP242" /LENGTH=58 /DNA_ID=CAMNT_0027875147 /DNA_START=906 /DNA_END=1082 /DNA_ORIENTATION=-